MGIIVSLSAYGRINLGISHGSEKKRYDLEAWHLWKSIDREKIRYPFYPITLSELQSVAKTRTPHDNNAT